MFKNLKLKLAKGVITSLLEEHKDEIIEFIVNIIKEQGQEVIDKVIEKIKN